MIPFRACIRTTWLTPLYLWLSLLFLIYLNIPSIWFKRELCELSVTVYLQLQSYIHISLKIAERKLPRSCAPSCHPLVLPVLWCWVCTLCNVLMFCCDVTACRNVHCPPRLISTQPSSSWLPNLSLPTSAVPVSAILAVTTVASDTIWITL